jgi:opacity protein-like surface antigen
MKRRVLLLASCLSSALAMSANFAHSSDLYPIYGVQPTYGELREISTAGWYLRGDVSLDFKGDIDGSRTAYIPTTSVSRAFDDASLEDGVGGGVGIGYQFNSFLRGDVTARYEKSDLRASMDLSDICGTQCYLRDNADVATWDLMANAYVDLGTYAGLTPYIGAGIGAVNVSYENATAEGCFAITCVPVGLPDESSWRFAYALNAGVAYDINPSLALDLGYRYMRVEGGSMPGLEVADLGLGISGTGVTGQDDGFDRHTIQAGIRYKIF